jgi:hypothetical protein
MIYIYIYDMFLNPWDFGGSPILGQIAPRISAVSPKSPPKKPQLLRLVKYCLTYPVKCSTAKKNQKR